MMQPRCRIHALLYSLVAFVARIHPLSPRARLKTAFSWVPLTWSAAAAAADAAEAEAAAAAEAEAAAVAGRPR